MLQKSLEVSLRNVVRASLREGVCCIGLRPSEYVPSKHREFADRRRCIAVALLRLVARHPHCAAPVPAVRSTVRPSADALLRLVCVIIMGITHPGT